MRPDLAAFFEHAYADLAALLGAELLEADRGREPGDPRADDHDVIFHRFAVAHSIPFVARGVRSTMTALPIP